MNAFAKFWEWMSDDLKYVIKQFREIQRASSDSDGGLAWSCLMNSTSYRLPESATKDRWIGFRELVRTSQKILKPKQAFHNVDPTSNSAIIGGLFREEKLITEYITKSAGKNQRVYFAKDELPSLPEQRWKFLWQLWIFAVPLAFQCITDERRSNIALSIREVAENAGLLMWLSQLGVQQVYDFIPYEKDGNFASLLLKGKNIRVIKVPSPGPLATHNSSLLGDEIVLSSPYQEEEIQHFEKTIRIKKISKWIPERAFTYIDKYLEKDLPTKQQTIGFYSHGSWIRAKEGHADDGMGIFEAEKKLLHDLSTFLANYPEFSLIIFRHPREKKPELAELCDQYYKPFFTSSQINYSNSIHSTALSFDECDMGIGAFSTILYERMFCGYKTLIGNYGIPAFPIPGSSLENICVNSFEKLEALLLRNSVSTAENYFIQNGLKGYHFQEYPYFSDRKRSS